MSIYDRLDDVRSQFGVGQSGEYFSIKEAGDHKCRIVSDAHVVAKHWVGGKSITCVGAEKGCVTCNDHDADPKDKKPSVRFFMYVIDRKDGIIKLAEFSYSIIEAVKDLKMNEEWKFEGDCPPWDITITHTIEGSGKKPSDHSYTVIPSPRNIGELTDAEKLDLKDKKPIEDIVEAMKAKALKELQDTGIISPPPTVEPEVTKPSDEPAPF